MTRLIILTYNKERAHKIFPEEATGSALHNGALNDFANFTEITYVGASFYSNEGLQLY